MLNDLLARAQKYLPARPGLTESGDCARQYLLAYERSQREKYVPVEPHSFFRRVIAEDIREHLVQAFTASSSPCDMILGFFLSKTLPPADVFSSMLSKTEVTTDFALLIASMVFHARDNTITQLYIENALSAGKSPALLQVLDFQVLATFLFVKQSEGLSRQEKAEYFRATRDSLVRLAGTDITPARHKAYDAVYLSVLNDRRQATACAVKAAVGQVRFCTPFSAINTFHDASEVHAQERLAEQPAALINGTPQADACLLTACDKNYFQRYFRMFCTHSDFTGVSHLHLQCINFKPSLKQIETATNGTGLTVTVGHERFSGGYFGDAFGTWCATARFRALPRLLRLFDTVVVADIDGYISSRLSGLLQMTEPGLYAHVCEDSDHRDIRLPWNLIYAGNCIFRREKKILDFADRCGQLCDKKLSSMIAAQERVLYFDQGTLAAVALALDVDVKPIPMFFIQGSANSGSFAKNRASAEALPAF